MKSILGDRWEAVAGEWEENASDVTSTLDEVALERAKPRDPMLITLTTDIPEHRKKISMPPL